MPINLQDNCTRTLPIDEQFFIGCTLGGKRSDKEYDKTKRHYSPIFEVYAHVEPTFSSSDRRQMSRAGGLLLRLGGNGNLNVATLFESYLIAISVSQGIFNTEISIPVVRPGHSDLFHFAQLRNIRPIHRLSKTDANVPFYTERLVSSPFLASNVDCE